MRITIDATSFLLRSAGIKSYTFHWFHALRQASNRQTIRAFPLIETPGELQHDRSMLPLLPTYARIALLHFVNTFGGLDAFLEKADIFHASNQIHRPPKNARLTATIHDLTCWKMPELHTPANVRADQRFAARILSQADGIIAVSESTREDAIHLLGIREERIETIHSGIPDAFFQVPAEDVFLVREHLGIEKPYVLSVGTVEPRKNLDRLLDAWFDLKPELRRQYDLLLAGPMGWANNSTARRITSGAQGVRHLGYVPEEMLPGLTAGALVFAYPSLYEGFGFPVAQAMATGVPVLTSNISALPEIAGDGAELVDPLSVTEIRSALERLLESDSRRELLATRGKERAQNYRWSLCARRSLQFFERIAGR